MWKGDTALFLAVEGGLYAYFLTIDILRLDLPGVPAKYAGVLLCLLFSVLAARRGGDRLVPLALALTATADWFLLVQNDGYLFGVAIFLAVQTVYLLRLRQGESNGAYWLRGGLALLMGLVLEWVNMATPLNLLAGLYFSQLLSNAILAWTLQGHLWRLFALGLTLFAGCDLCVGLVNSGLAAFELERVASVGMWLFYLPSQVLISLSALPKQEVSHEAK